MIPAIPRKANRVTEKLSLSVRARLLVMCLGLILVFGCSSLLLGLLIVDNQTHQLAQQEQYRRFGIIQDTQQAMTQYRHSGGRLNSATLLRDPGQEREARAQLDAARAVVEQRLDELEGFDAADAATIRDALERVPGHTEQVMAALLAGRQADAQPSLAELQRLLDRIEATLAEANARERERAAEMQAVASRHVRRAIPAAGLVIVAGGFAGVLLVLVVVRSIIRPLKVTTEAIRQVNAGQTAIDLPPVTRDEFGDTALALRQFRDHAEKLRRLAYQDALTGLGNRAALEDALQRAIDRCRGSAQRFALLQLDLDKFRSVNEKLGNKGGDRYLCEAAARLQRFIPDDALAFRYSGDQFAVLVEDLAGEPAAEAQLAPVADCILRGISEPYPVGRHLLNMSMSIGVAVFPADGQTVEQLIGSAEAAVYAAKSQGRNTVRFASAQVTGEARRRIALTADLRRGLASRQFETFYQPIVDVRRRRVAGAEALLRWHHPELGLLLPGDFIGIAEEAGLIADLSAQCVDDVHRQLRAWLRDGREHRVSVNLSARQVQDERTLRLLRKLHDEDRTTARLIDFELTESLLFDSSEQTRRLLEDVRALGYRLGLDDFGTGYSSFSYLQRLPIDKIKIDRLFVSQMATSRSALAIVSATLALARSLELEVIAEGVETAGQMRALRELGCALQQGFLFSPALPAAEFERWARNFEREPVAG